MKLRHAVALALTGWYLMIPPRFETAPNSEVLIPSFGKDWLIVNQYDDGQQCAESLRYALTHEKGTAKLAAQTHVQVGEAGTAVRYGGICVRDDDPRLKGN